MNKDWKFYFYEISKIPRKSGNEGKIKEYLVNFANERKLKYYIDEQNNDKEWENIMYNLINKTIKDKNIKDIEFESFVDIFIIRAVSYWNRAQRISAIDAEKIITKIAENLRRHILNAKELNEIRIKSLNY